MEEQSETSRPIQKAHGRDMIEAKVHPRSRVNCCKAIHEFGALQTSLRSARAESSPSSSERVRRAAGTSERLSFD